MNTLRAHLSEEREPYKITRSLRYTTPIGAEDAVWWEITGAVLPSPLDRHDLAVTALLFLAMRQGRDLHVAGPVSWSLLAKLEEFQSAWVKWRPELYRCISISADQIVMTRCEPQLRAVALFSGGVDGAFTLWRHRNRAVGHASRGILSAVFIHGFDIPLRAEAAFRRAASAAAETLASASIPLTCIRTNWRVTCGDWESEHGAGLVSCLRQFQGHADAGLIGSDLEYGHLRTPWGSNPITDPLLSSDDFEIVYDGGGFTRGEKIAAIADWERAVNGLRVCWEGPATGGNCGVCEKCIRTKLNFMAAGKPLPPSLAGKPTIMQILRVGSRDTWLSDEVVAMARLNGIRGPWVSAVACAKLRTQAIAWIRNFARGMAWARAAHHAYQRLKSRSVARREWAQSTSSSAQQRRLRGMLGRRKLGGIAE